MELRRLSSLKLMYSLIVLYNTCVFEKTQEVRAILSFVCQYVCLYCLSLYIKPDILTQIQLGLLRKLHLLTDVPDFQIKQ